MKIFIQWKEMLNRIKRVFFLPKMWKKKQMANKILTKRVYKTRYILFYLISIFSFLVSIYYYFNEKQFDHFWPLSMGLSLRWWKRFLTWETKIHGLETPNYDMILQIQQKKNNIPCNNCIYLWWCVACMIFLVQKIFLKMWNLMDRKIKKSSTNWKVKSFIYELYNSSK